MDDGASVPKRDTERSHGNCCRSHIGPQPAIDNRKDKRQSLGIRDILLSAKWRPRVSRFMPTVPYAANSSWRSMILDSLLKLRTTSRKESEEFNYLTPMYPLNMYCYISQGEGKDELEMSY